MDRHARNRSAVQVDFACVRRHQANDHVERRGLAGAIGAEQADHFAAFHMQRDIVHYLTFAVTLLQAADDQGTYHVIFPLIPCAAGSPP